jgi:PII-like signaling protein
VVDSEPVIRQILPEIRGMVKEGLVVLLDAEVIEAAEE